jgi:hypothetical protein
VWASAFVANARITMTKNPDNVKRGRNSKARGKSVERLWAKMVGGQRIHDGVGYGDVQTETTIWEVKSFQHARPKWMIHAFDQAADAEAITLKDGRVAVRFIENGVGVWVTMDMVRDTELRPVTEREDGDTSSPAHDGRHDS